MVLHAANDDRRAIELLGDSTEVEMDFVPEAGIAEEWFAVFRREDEVQEGGGKGLGHENGENAFIVQRGFSEDATPLGLMRSNT
jgi:hypothetical protein